MDTREGERKDEKVYSRKGDRAGLVGLPQGG
jgi:hypothetical protein